MSLASRFSCGRLATGQQSTPNCIWKKKRNYSIFEMFMMEEIPNNHLGCKKTVNNRINYQPQLVSFPDFWIINSTSGYLNHNDPQCINIPKFEISLHQKNPGTTSILHQVHLLIDRAGATNDAKFNGFKQVQCHREFWTSCRFVFKIGIFSYLFWGWFHLLFFWCLVILKKKQS